MIGLRSTTNQTVQLALRARYQPDPIKLSAGIKSVVRDVSWANNTRAGWIAVRTNGSIYLNVRHERGVSRNRFSVSSRSFRARTDVLRYRTRTIERRSSSGVNA
jgi:hypothetical protein|uniref:Uncharacterized protein n=1 Tax=Sipha flava TaxID=143950 RepID=A0A2S2QKZ5_9HEMI